MQPLLSGGASPVTTSGPLTVEALEAECNILGMDLLNILEYINEAIDHRKITLLIQKLSNSMDSIVLGVSRLRNIDCEDLETRLEERQKHLAHLVDKLRRYQQIYEQEEGA